MSAGYGNDGTLEGSAAWDAGKFGNAVLFDAGAWVELPPEAWDPIEMNVTVAFWAYGGDAQPVNHFAFAAYSADSNPARQASGHIPWSNGNVYWDTGYDGSAYDRLFTALPPEFHKGAWVHWAFTKDGDAGEQKIYINGELFHEGTGYTRPMTGVNVFVIGCRGTGGRDQNYVGTIDDFRLYNRALTPEDIAVVMTGAGAGFPLALGPDPEDGAMIEATWANLSWRPGSFSVSHDVYLGTNFDDVNGGAAETFIGNQASTTLIVGFAGFPVPDGLVPGTTYYWRIDEVNDANAASPWKGDVWSFWIPPKTAYNPVPTEGAKFITSEPTLSWTAGFNAKLHTVYFGDNFDDVNNASAGAAQAGTTFTPGTLELDKTYYWRVDEFDPPATHKGDIWSFMTVPEIAITDASLMGWWKLDENMGTTAVDWSGHGRHGSLEGEPQWVAGYDGGALEFDGGNHVDTGYTENLAEWTIACWTKSPAAPSGDSPSGPLHREQNYQFNWNHGNEVFRGAAAINVGGTWHAAKYTPLSANTWYHLAATYDGNVFNAYRDGVLITSNTAPSGAANSETNSVKLGRHAAAAQFFTGTVDDARVYNRALTVEEIQEVMKGDTSVARHPNPAPGSTPNIGQAATLTWSAGDSAAQHDVYFGTDEAAVAGADASDTTGVYRGRQPGASYSTAADIEWGGGPYYWRIDEFNTDSTIGTGWLWSFSVADYLTVDGFESYNDIDPPDPASNRIFDKWMDGFGTLTNGALVGNDLPPYAETSVVQGGAQSMIYRYDNAGKTSEATLTLTEVDWTVEGVTKLSLWLRGASANAADRIFVALNGTAVVYHDDPAATQSAGWTEWVIDLSAFGGLGVDLTNVSS
ncbi:MAG: LamG domain-containing protein, partial [Planctomycetota bacterium]